MGPKPSRGTSQQLGVQARSLRPSGYGQSQVLWNVIERKIVHDAGDELVCIAGQRQFMDKHLAIACQRFAHACEHCAALPMGIKDLFVPRTSRDNAANIVSDYHLGCQPQIVDAHAGPIYPKQKLFVQQSLNQWAYSGCLVFGSMADEDSGHATTPCRLVRAG